MRFQWNRKHNKNIIIHFGGAINLFANNCFIFRQYSTLAAKKCSNTRTIKANFNNLIVTLLVSSISLLIKKPFNF